MIGETSHYTQIPVTGEDEDRTPGKEPPQFVSASESCRSRKRSPETALTNVFGSEVST